ncbi:MarR family winged helix-turn-helix transcriptional regulator [Streptomyces zingiberis]|uniref:Winged helix-turn-helix transcriptional regulator n=1 Tax=Streptomyces zingiberis TaxID=2053010 RepID=A0ABX1BRU3_9ACTN|nr:MarR family winged helix-turn-helix transcriptional regulator [Streptomyces zingiberis]NJP99155.1 winged helix-turn-helix transcriptional regulator [Streptomyces zingiberis]
MAEPSRYEELVRGLGVIGVVKRSLTRALPRDAQPGPTAVLALLDHHGELRMSELADLLGVGISVASRHVAHAAERGWVVRAPDPLDGRSQLLSLSPAGGELLREVSAHCGRLLAEALHDWPDEDLDRLGELLDRLRTGFDGCRSRDRPSPGRAATVRTTPSP